MTLSLSIAHTYQSIEIALCNGDHCIDRATEETGHASKHLIPLISSLLEKNQVTLKQIQWIAVNQGPGPFTTLRVMIASVNGLSFATGIPLIGIDGIRALLAQYPSNQTTIALLDAFNKDVYYGIQTHDGTLQTGYEEYQPVLPDDCAISPSKGDAYRQWRRPYIKINLFWLWVILHRSTHRH